jgi:hypothetical protein
MYNLNPKQKGQIKSLHGLLEKHVKDFPCKDDEVLEKSVIINGEVVTSLFELEERYSLAKIQDDKNTVSQIKKIRTQSYTYGLYYQNKRNIQHVLFDCKSDGFRTGHISVAAAVAKKLGITTGPDRPVPDHLFSRNVIAKYLIELYRKGELTYEKLCELILILCATVEITSNENTIVSGIITKNAFEINDLFQMKHYKEAGIYLVRNYTKKGNDFDYTRPLKEEVESSFLQEVIIDDGLDTIEQQSFQTSIFKSNSNIEITTLENYFK